MATRYSSAKSADAIKVWWEHTQTRLGLFLDVMRAGGAISDSEIDDALHYFSVRIPEFEQANYPQNASEIRGYMLSALRDMEQSLSYRQEHNVFSAQSRLDMAHSNFDALRLRLVQVNILL